ncbi:MAG: factor-independent urate hydroxylase [Verrucomicrobiota bacterium]
MAKLEHNTYGKHRVRVMRFHRRDSGVHEVLEITADVLLEGDLAGSYLSDDNSSIVPTDTVKNTVTVLANDYEGTCRTEFAQVVGRHFLETYEHITGVNLEIRERRWDRMTIDGEAHPHSFTHAANGVWFAKGSFKKSGTTKLTAGIRDHLVMKTTGSGFVGYNECELTTLPPTEDRFFSTYLAAEWEFGKAVSEGFSEVDELALAAAHRVFATTYSPSVQRTLFETGEAILEVAPKIERVSLTMPNVHFLPIDLTKLGRSEAKVVLPTDEPHGQIVATVGR